MSVYRSFARWSLFVFSSLNLTITKIERESLLNPSSPPYPWRVSDQNSSDSDFTILRKKKKARSKMTAVTYPINNKWIIYRKYIWISVRSLVRKVLSYLWGQPFRLAFSHIAALLLTINKELLKRAHLTLTYQFDKQDPPSLLGEIQFPSCV